MTAVCQLSQGKLLPYKLQIKEFGPLPSGKYLNNFRYLFVLDDSALLWPKLLSLSFRCKSEFSTSCYVLIIHVLSVNKCFTSLGLWAYSHIIHPSLYQNYLAYLMFSLTRQTSTKKRPFPLEPQYSVLPVKLILLETETLWY